MPPPLAGVGGSAHVLRGRPPLDRRSQTASPGVPPGAYARGVPDATVPPGWYPDPTGRFTERFWNGGSWTSDVRRYEFQQKDDKPPPTPAELPGVFIAMPPDQVIASLTVALAAKGVVITSQTAASLAGSVGVRGNPNVFLALL